MCIIHSRDASHFQHFCPNSRSEGKRVAKRAKGLCLFYARNWNFNDATRECLFNDFRLCVFLCVPGGIIFNGKLLLILLLVFPSQTRFMVRNENISVLVKLWSVHKFCSASMTFYSATKRSPSQWLRSTKATREFRKNYEIISRRKCNVLLNAAPAQV